MSERLITKIKWPEDENLGWTYYGAEDKVKLDIVMETLNRHFSDDSLYVCWTRQNCFEVSKENILSEVNNILGYEDFRIWNKSFTRAIQFNKIGVLKCGEVCG